MGGEIKGKMKNKKNWEEIISQIIVAILIQIILYGILYVGAYFSKEKLNIVISTSTKKDDIYVTSINIKNYQTNKSIDSITIWSKANIDVTTLNYRDIEEYEDKLIIKNIPPSYDGTLIVYSKEEINEKNTKFETKEKNTVKFLYNQKEEIVSYWKQITPSIIIYVIMVVVSKNITKKQLEKYYEENKRLEADCRHIENRLDAVDKEKKEIYKSNLKLKIFLHRKLVDYAKELEFYRNLIKSVIDKNSNKDDICYQITKSLKTFKTLDKINLEDLEIDSLELSEVEKDEIRKELK